jgi:periplasmic divalent cation tolerance protein
MTKLLAVYTTVANEGDALAMARDLVERRLAACAQIEPIRSLYRWQGSVHDEPEFRILFKTTDAQYAAVEAAIRELHPYELPAIHAVEAARVHEPYAQWVADESSGDR